MRRFAVMAALATVLTACGGSPASSGVHLVRLPEDTPWPQVVEGALTIDVEEGPVGDDEVSEVNFGTMELTEGSLLVEVRADAIRDAGVSRSDLLAGLQVRASVTGFSEYGGGDLPTYRLAALKRVAEGPPTPGD